VGRSGVRLLRRQSSIVKPEFWRVPWLVAGHSQVPGAGARCGGGARCGAWVCEVRTWYLVFNSWPLAALLAAAGGSWLHDFKWPMWHDAGLATQSLGLTTHDPRPNSASSQLPGVCGQGQGQGQGPSKGRSQEKRGEATRLRACAELAQWGRPWYCYRTPLGTRVRGSAPHKKIKS
jgi:hypothetical protein